VVNISLLCFISGLAPSVYPLVHSSLALQSIIFGRTNVGSNEDMLASTSLYTLHFVSLPHHLLIWSLFTLLVSYPVEQARRQNIHVVWHA
jgi:hypothetical protein